MFSGKDGSDDRKPFDIDENGDNTDDEDKDDDDDDDDGDMCSEGDDTTELETSPSCSKSSSYGEEGKSEISRDFDDDFGMASVSTSSKQFHLE